jgi:hypothetical protein
MSTNSIEINDRKIYFQVRYDCSEWGEYWETEFFEEYETLSKKKWVLFGPTITWEEPKIMFTITRDIYSPRLTKEYWRREITKKLKKYDALCNRQTEINSKQYI